MLVGMSFILKVKFTICVSVLFRFTIFVKYSFCVRFSSSCSSSS